MRHFPTTPIALIALSALVSPATAAAAPDAAAPDSGARVAILGYHEFSETAEQTEMRIRTSKFRSQLEVIRDLGLGVISMDQFIRWKQGEIDLPGHSVMITIDDGWKSVYTDAFPILREFGMPFTIFLYKDYVEGGNKALSTAMIREMCKQGATIGSHSVSHPYPADVKKKRAEGVEPFARFLRDEMGESKRYLEMNFGRHVRTYAYPGGFLSDDMFPIAAEVGYSHLFTVQPAKVTRATPDRMIPRYMILGTHDRVFELATDFSAAPAQPAGVIAGLTSESTLPVSPAPGSLVNERLPTIEASLAGIDDIDPATVVMKVGGFGAVDAEFDPQTGRLAWRVDRPLRQRFCHVQVSWRDGEGSPADKPLQWSFQLDRSAAYLPRN